MEKSRYCASLTAMVLLWGCSGSGRLEVDSRIGSVSQSLSAGDSLELGDGELAIDAAQVSVSEIEFEGGKEGRISEREAELGPADIALALDGGLTMVAASDVEAGRYHTLGIELRRGGDSIVVSGVYFDEPFTWTSAMGHEVEFRLRPEVDVADGGEAAVGVEFEVGQWFTDADGAVLDPTNAANQAAIEQRILATLAAHAEIEFEGTDDD